MSSSSADGLIAVSATFIGLCVSAVGLRFQVRKHQNVPLLVDDWLALVALCMFVAGAICIFIDVGNRSLGYSDDAKMYPEIHRTYQSPKSKTLQIVINLLSTSCLASIKLSALFFYRRIFCVKGHIKWFDVATLATIAVVVLWLFVFDFMLGFQCGTHFSALWDGTYVRYCTLSFPVLYGLAISDFLLDVWILALPIPCVLKLHTSTARKLSILGIFLLAFAGLGASIARMVQYIQVELAGKTYFLNHNEERATSQAIYFSQLEAGLSLVAVNLPSLWAITSMVEPKKMMQGIRSWISLPRSSNSGASVAHGSVAQNAGKDGSLRTESETSKHLGSTQGFRNDLESNRFEALATYEPRATSQHEGPPTKTITYQVSRELR